MTTVTATKEHPIFFIDKMVRAILDGKKTQTRRVWTQWKRPINLKAGDVLWVREPWAKVYHDTGAPELGYRWEYRADTDNPYPGGWPVECADDPDCGRWKPSIHMPKAACRLWLRVTDVRRELLTDITVEDALAEGYPYKTSFWSQYPPRDWFRTLWDSINEKRGLPWVSKPEVVVIEFEILEVRHAE